MSVDHNYLEYLWTRKDPPTFAKDHWLYTMQFGADLDVWTEAQPDLKTHIQANFDKYIKSQIKE